MNEIERLLQAFSKYQLIQKSQKMRGLNDFNIFTTLLDKSDEVRLHSRFLHFLLNPLGDHGQGTLFLDLFLIECDLHDYFSFAENCRVYKEYRNIDLYMTDGDRHIIIENKIYASDQELQIQRVMNRDGESRASVKKRLKSQMSLEEKLNYADYVLDNTSSRDELKSQVYRLHTEFKSLV